ncbi:hypothetical protein D3C87_475550 [compost metagenome]
MDISKIKIGKRVSFVMARNKNNVRRGTVSAINHTSTGPFIAVTMKDGTTLQTRAALVS